MKKLLFIPGLLCEASLLQSLIDALPKEYIYLKIDISNSATIEELAQMLWQQVDGEVSLVGFSLGAWIALQAYLLSTQRCCCAVLVMKVLKQTAARDLSRNYSC